MTGPDDPQGCRTCAVAPFLIIRSAARCGRRAAVETVSLGGARTENHQRHSPRSRIPRARPPPSHLTPRWCALVSTPTAQAAAKMCATWAAERVEHFYSSPLPTPSSRRSGRSVWAARYNYVLMQPAVGGLALLEVDAREAAEAVRGAGAGGRRRLHCLRSGGRADARGGGPRRRSGGVRCLRTGPWGSTVLFCVLQNIVTLAW